MHTDHPRQRGKSSLSSRSSRIFDRTRPLLVNPSRLLVSIDSSPRRSKRSPPACLAGSKRDDAQVRGVGWLQHSSERHAVLLRTRTCQIDRASRVSRIAAPGIVGRARRCGRRLPASQAVFRKVQRMMKGIIAASCFALLALSPAGAQPAALKVDPEIQAAVMRVLNEFDEAFNRKDPIAWERTFNFPHYRLVGDQLLTFEKPGQITADDMRVRLPPDFHHGAITRQEIIQASANKVHVAVSVSRYRADGSVIESFDTLYVLTKDRGHWGMKLRSTFAPVR
jgi:hypothetical protein